MILNWSKLIVDILALLILAQSVIKIVAGDFLIDWRLVSGLLFPRHRCSKCAVLLLAHCSCLLTKFIIAFISLGDKLQCASGAGPHTDPLLQKHHELLHQWGEDCVFDNVDASCWNTAGNDWSSLIIKLCFLYFDSSEDGSLIFDNQTPEYFHLTGALVNTSVIH